jgi:hypothetical protein
MSECQLRRTLFDVFSPGLAITVYTLLAQAERLRADANIRAEILIVVVVLLVKNGV